MSTMTLTLLDPIGNVVETMTVDTNDPASRDAAADMAANFIAGMAADRLACTMTLTPADDA